MQHSWTFLRQPKTTKLLLSIQSFDTFDRYPLAQIMVCRVVYPAHHVGIRDPVEHQSYSFAYRNIIVSMIVAPPDERACTDSPGIQKCKGSIKCFWLE